jgi:hypothetical protein
MRLLGAKEFLKTVKSGTLCIEFWEHSKEQCYEIIEDFKKGLSPKEICEKHYGEYYIFGDNGFSLTFLVPSLPEDEEIEEIKGNKYNCIFIYDKNIVGDASPTRTLQLVFDNEAEWPEEIPIEGSSKTLSDEEIKIIQEWYLENETFDNHDWALKCLETEEYYKDNEIVNFKMER